MSKIVAECGVNFNNFEEAKRLVEMAKFAGADAVKFQTFWNIGLEKYELTKEQWIELKELADSLCMEFMTTPHWGSPLTFYKDEDYEVIDFVDTLVKTHKIASPYLTNKKYVSYIASKGKPIYMSTGSITRKDGMATMAEIKETLSWVPNADITILHCVSKYPVSDFISTKHVASNRNGVIINAHYERILKLKRFGKPVGLSDHTTNKMIQCWPVVEKHFKLNDNCIDAKISLNPEEFREMVRNIRNYQSVFRTI
jgi:N,N'-diacetyllegionaminate synthase